MKINSETFEGYIWKSNSIAPEIVKGEFSIELIDNENPFVAEGYLYCASKGLSFSIKHFDGKYHVNRYDVAPSDFENDDVEVKEFLGNNMEGKWLKFLQYWKENYDDISNMKVLIPSKLVFVGFKNEG